MKLRFLARWLAVAALFLSAASAHAYDFSFNGIYYNVLSEEDRTVEVCCNLYTHYSGSIIIPERVLDGGKTYTVTSIESGAFSGCSALTSVTFPASLTSIGDFAFQGCSALTSVDLSSTSLTSIGYATFYNCDALTSVAFPTSLTSIRGEAFRECVALTSVDLSSTSLTSIGDDAFLGCEALTSVTFPASLTSIGDYAFLGCDALTSVDLSSTSLTSIGNYAFWECDALTSVSFPTSLTSIGNYAFWECDALTSVSFPASLTSIGYYAFKDCDALTNLTVDESNPAFASRDNVLYSKNLDTLVCYPTGANKEVVIPDMVCSVREGAFPGEVSTIYCQPQTPPTAVDGEFQYMFTDETLMNAVLYVPVGTKAAYMQVDPWRNFWNVEEMDFATVGIDGVAAQGVPSVTVRGGAIVVEGAAATDVVEVFAADGRCAYRGASATISHLPGGIYVVRVGKHVQKVAL